MEENCPICIVSIEEENSKPLTNCGHIFHRTCIKQWYFSKKNALCPICRCAISKQDIQKKRSMKELITSGKININYRNISGDNFLIISTKNNDIDMIKFLLESGININHTNDCGNTALMWASFIGNLEVVTFLIEKGANIDHQNNCGYNSLMWAIKNGHFNVSKFLIDSGADIDLSSNKGVTAKYLARIKKRISILEYLNT